MQIRRLTVFAPLLAPAIAAAAQEAPPRDSIVDRDALPLDKRACTPNGCACQVGYKGQYCSECLGTNGHYVITDWGDGAPKDHIFECNGNGGCCNYGAAADCAAGGGLNGRCG